MDIKKRDKKRGADDKTKGAARNNFFLMEWPRTFDACRIIVLSGCARRFVSALVVFYPA